MFRVEDWLPEGNRAIDVAPEGGCKTIFGCAMAVCIASGHDFLGHSVGEGSVMIIDEETPEPVLRTLLDRFAMGLGFNGYSDLPLGYHSMEGFRFGRKNCTSQGNNEILSRDDQTPQMPTLSDQT